jgi:hypothetical protein
MFSPETECRQAGGKKIVLSIDKKSIFESIYKYK